SSGKHGESRDIIRLSEAPPKASKAVDDLVLLLCCTGITASIIAFSDSWYCGRIWPLRI
ncbi:hypothetical protein SK128_001313, partial [Halocaridina rubra]